ncbi:SusC/RagA family TonB-linked outer membrane protein [Thermophagus xiamenensis]|uniref:TonB-linked outer membrane protein, SusC/RagA family n=1 Tax=Thermophagus xiamenensis TaxID=385682 RepID=A0A1I1XH24_9BACT|nr:SusC/RagA family TonB-linked outer membrane protein [Thermophagus xiamenensis]SFE06704.1 TonB-linked outer membrane protein, SusC/RagA family [Thermophagus xiamenensis]
MKQIIIRIILLAMLVDLTPGVKAQSTTENETDSTYMVNDTSRVQIAFRKVTKSDLWGSVAVVDVQNLIKKNYHTYSLDNMQGYIGGWTGNSLWGMDDYLVLVDGVPRDANNVIPAEIDHITFLKGASAVVLYGSRAAKGVIFITTKRGQAHPLKINVRANSGFHVSKSYPKYLGSAEYMTLYNEALENDGLQPAYSDEEIYRFASGQNPYRYPNVDFYSSDYLKKAYNRSDVVTEISGGNERARYYTNIGYYRQGDLFKIGEAKNNYTDRLNVRGNIDLKLNDYISAFVNANATFYNARSANVTDSDPDDDTSDTYWTYAATMRPNRISPLIPISFLDQNALNAWTLVNNSSNIVDGKYFLAGTQVDMTNVFADFYAGGYSKWTSRQFQFDTGIDFNLDNFLKGLSFHTQFAVDYATSYTTSYNNSYAVYEPSWYSYNGVDVIADLTKYNNDERSGEQNISGSTNRQTLAFSGWFEYNTSLNNAHNLSAMLIANGFQQTESEVYHRTSNANLGLQLGYNFKNKYYSDFGAAIVHSAKLAPGHRNAFSPSITLGWRLSNESFMASSSVIDDMVLSVSASILNTDLDIDDYYMYEANYTQADGAWWGWYDGASEQSTNSIRGENKDLTFIKRKELSANLRASMWDNLFSINTSFFINKMEGLIIEPSTIFPNYFFTYYPDASFIPYVNFNDDQRMGFDFDVNFNKRLGNVHWTLGLAGTYYTTEATRRDENYEYDYQKREGRPVDGIWGLESDGFFQSQEEIDNSPEQVFGGVVKPGDIKYVDQNNDNIINEQDVVYLGKGGWYGAPFTLGVNLTARWKNLTFFAMGTGGFGAYAMKNNSYFWVYGNRKYSEVVRNRWTEETKETATYPRLTTTSGTNNFRNSDFWLYKTDRFNLAKVQITYDLPKNILQNSFFKEVSAYISGSNLLTIAKEKEILEMNITDAPQTRFYNIGLKAAF